MATKSELERRKLEAEIRKIEAEAATAEYERDQYARDDAAATSAEHQHNIYTFIGPVGGSSVEKCMAHLGRWARRDPGCDITIVFNSPGGSVFDGLALYDEIEALKDRGHRITTVARGMAASMGGILLQVGHERVVGKNAWVLIHEVSSAMRGSTTDMEEDLKFTKRLQDRCVEILAARSTMSKAQIMRRWKKTDWWISADEALELGFADRVG